MLVLAVPEHLELWLLREELVVLIMVLVVVWAGCRKGCEWHANTQLDTPVTRDRLYNHDARKLA